ncbi:hypothetical protein [Aureimonas ureilytica]|nr:hypothetical protein [Aureimonas ureilytica]
MVSVEAFALAFSWKKRVRSLKSRASLDNASAAAFISLATPALACVT